MFLNNTCTFTLIFLSPHRQEHQSSMRRELAGWENSVPPRRGVGGQARSDGHPAGGRPLGCQHTGQPRAVTAPPRLSPWAEKTRGETTGMSSICITLGRSTEIVFCNRIVILRTF